MRRSPETLELVVEVGADDLEVVVRQRTPRERRLAERLEAAVAGVDHEPQRQLVAELEELAADQSTDVEVTNDVTARVIVVCEREQRRCRNRRALEMRVLDDRLELALDRLAVVARDADEHDGELRDQQQAANLVDAATCIVVITPTWPFGSVHIA